MNEFLYHMVPDGGVIGGVLHPLNELQHMLPAVYEAQARKYTTRRALMDVTLPGLGCRWNDVLHLGTIDPRVILRTQLDVLSQLNLPIPERYARKREFFRIPVERVHGESTIYFVNESRTGPSDFGVPELQCSPFYHHRYRELRTVPAPMIAYYREELASGRLPLWWKRLPHVLFRGSIDTGALDVVPLLPC